MEHRDPWCTLLIIISPLEGFNLNDQDCLSLSDKYLQHQRPAFTPPKVESSRKAALVLVPQAITSLL